MPDTAPLPPGLDGARFAAVLEEMRTVVGAANIYATPESLSPYLDVMSSVRPEQRMPGAAVCPASVEEAQAVVQIAHRARLPLWSYGTGKNWAYGGPTPLLPGYVCLDLKRMNRVLEVNEDLAYAVVEPGVSYFQLYHHLRATGSKLWIDCAAPGWGGVIGNAFEHGAGYTPYGDHVTMACGMEVLLGDGSLVRTGMGALPGSKAWTLHKYGYGPYLDGMFTQSNLGVITKMGIWLMPEPPAYKPFLITYDREDALHEIAERLRPLKIGGVLRNATVLEHISYSAGVQRLKKDFWDRPGLIPQSVWADMARTLDIGMWNLYSAIYDTPENAELTWSVVRERLGTIPGARVFLQGDRAPDDVSWNYREQLMRGQPNMAEFNIVNWGGGGHHNFTALAPITGRDAVRLLETMRTVMNRHGFDYICEYVIGFRGLICLLMVMFDPRDAEQCARADACSQDIIRTAATQGSGELKSHLNYMDLILSVYSGQDGGLHKTLQKIKDALDPHGVLSPGKSGLWPADWSGPRAL
jgi:4-cresol dehydrogenase (hydroxylating) flavoprotein subunit